MSKLDKLTSNQYYGGLNRRFVRRSNLLKKLGFKYETPSIEVYEGKIVSCPVALYVRRKYCKVFAIPVSIVHHADKRAWHDCLKFNLY